MDEHSHYWAPVPAYLQAERNGAEFVCASTSGGVSKCPAIWRKGRIVEDPATDDA